MKCFNSRNVQWIEILYTCKCHYDSITSVDGQLLSQPTIPQTDTHIVYHSVAYVLGMYVILPQYYSVIPFSCSHTYHLVYSSLPYSTNARSYSQRLAGGAGYPARVRVTRAARIADSCVCVSRDVCAHQTSSRRQIVLRSTPEISGRSETRPSSY